MVESATGSQVASYSYDSFGARTASGSLSQRYGFTGREFDAESGLIYFRARHYDPALGQFLQRDPIGFAAGDMNLYAYTWNDPHNWTDPSGLEAGAGYADLAGASLLFGYTVADVTAGAISLANTIKGFLTLVDIVQMVADAADGDDDGDKEKTPSTNPEDYDAVRGRPGKKNKETGEIWEKDKLHKDHWEVYRDKRRYERGQRDRSVWDDGRPKQTF